LTAKHTYPDKSAGQIRRRADVTDHTLTVSVRDPGIRLSEGFDLATSTKTLGMRIVNNLAKQIHADLVARRANPGAEFILRLPFFFDDAVSLRSSTNPAVPR